MFRYALTTLLLAASAFAAISDNFGTCQSDVDYIVSGGSGHLKIPAPSDGACRLACRILEVFGCQFYIFDPTIPLLNCMLSGGDVHAQATRPRTHIGIVMGGVNNNNADPCDNNPHLAPDFTDGTPNQCESDFAAGGTAPTAKARLARKSAERRSKFARKAQLEMESGSIEKRDTGVAIKADK